MNTLSDSPFNSMVSLTPLLNFWEKNMVSKCHHMAHMFAEIKQKLSETPQLQGAIKDLHLLDDFQDILNRKPKGAMYICFCQILLL